MDRGPWRKVRSNEVGGLVLPTNLVTCYRSDLAGMFKRLKEGASDLELFEEMPELAFKYQRGISAARAAVLPVRDPERAPVIEIYWGDSGTGKTRKAVSDHPDAYIVTRPREKGALWWDGYNGQKTVIVDEFYGWIQYDFILRLLDRYPLRVEVKGGTVNMSATHFIITSNQPWRDWYPNVEDKSALERRIKEFGKVTHFVKLDG